MNAQLNRKKILKKYENKNNTVEYLRKKYRIMMKLPESEVSRRLQLNTVYIDRIQLYRMESGQMIIEYFELIALCKVFNTLLRN